MPFRSFLAVFLAVGVGTALVVAALMVNRARPRVEVGQPNAQFVLATGKCAECHRRETPAIVHEFEMSKHSAMSINCLDCHQAVEGQEKLDHRGFTIAKRLTAANCQQCHRTQYQQFLRSRHAAPAWAAVSGPKDFSKEQIEFAEQYHKGAVVRPANPLVEPEGPAAVNAGCYNCHNVGKPNADGSIGTCTACHARHAASVELARLPSTCGQCHMGPDHSQVEIFTESKHGVLFQAQRSLMNLKADPKHLTTKDMPVPTCATCHMSGLNGLGTTHDVTERLSYWLFAPVSEKRPTYQSGQTHMQEVCLQCHTTPRVKEFYQQAEEVVASVNQLVGESQEIVKRVHAKRPAGAATRPFDKRMDYVAFDLWHYYGRTAKHGAFMGGADFVQWHGYYEIIRHLTELKEMAAEAERSGAAAEGPATRPTADARR